MEASKVDAVVPADIRPLIYEIRGTQVMLDRDLAGLYGVPTKALNQAVKRNAERFPDRFVFRLTDSEMNELVTNCDRFEKLKHSSAAMCAFTEQGIAMLSSVLRSAIAVQVSIRIMDAFVAMRRALASMVPLQTRLDMLAKRGRGVKVELVTHSNGELAESDFEAFAKQCGKFTKTICGICHDRFIIADQKEIYWSGASLKDAGRLTFAAAKLGAEMIPGLLKSVRNATSETKDYFVKGGRK